MLLPRAIPSPGHQRLPALRSLSINRRQSSPRPRPCLLPLRETPRLLPLRLRPPPVNLPSLLRLRAMLLAPLPRALRAPKLHPTWLQWSCLLLARQVPRPPSLRLLPPIDLFSLLRLQAPRPRVFRLQKWHPVRLLLG
jgi:hypothetical protein